VLAVLGALLGQVPGPKGRAPHCSHACHSCMSHCDKQGLCMHSVSCFSVCSFSTSAFALLRSTIVLSTRPLPFLVRDTADHSPLIPDQSAPPIRVHNRCDGTRYAAGGCGADGVGCRHRVALRLQLDAPHLRPPHRITPRQVCRLVHTAVGGCCRQGTLWHVLLRAGDCRG
jgi:hypothetical protein